MSIAIITGASSGLGRRYVDAVIAECPEVDEIWVIARNAERLAKIAAEYRHPRIVPVPLDLTDSRSYALLANRMEERRPIVRVLVNDAGAALGGEFAEQDSRRIMQMLRLNVIGITTVTRVCLPYMRRGSMILQVGSVSGFAPSPNLAAYSASKAYVRTFSVTLRQELRPRGIHVTAVQPGRMNTAMTMERNGSGLGDGRLGWIPSLDMNRLARNSIRAAKRNRATYTMGTFNKALAILTKIMPINLFVRFSTM
ncbi:SDR family NAD(P)-dependent oxidoreductase [Bifidobacterium sp. SMB2]|uniref:SDR family NAD(P)-dependent oxidoreductase n=1 Tax=Bifidobacterium saimiriisciurei TaxID=2661627 RepID=A0ABX0CFJ3_9BIFI|nr:MULTISPECIES: SDR family NAD(P)-dependent oxidoreductase [Bifidobacterium]NEG96630.1 SDR family NAD(P)-dependent oxidoreductase [Bifidobacterium sp. SMB2]NEH12535.1 SDR family NAD(P)-dependent oxidoreductase [Bifidobacterium saimiriisciurei]